MKQKKVLSFMVKTKNIKKGTLGEKFADWVVSNFAPKHHMRLKPKKGVKRKKKLNVNSGPLTMEKDI